jgi:uracil-DNA glycosylase
VFGDEVDHHRIGHHRGTEFVGDAGEFLERLLEDEGNVLAQV